ncbi:MAG: hypothetical protein KBS64_06410 [Treponema sp.]|nr:hypothetical protein [Candidatus Treponema equi]
MGILTSDNFKKFLREVTNDSYISIKEYEEGLKKHLNILSKDLNLGQLSCVYIAPKTPHNPDGHRSFNILYISPDGFSSDAYEKEYGTGEGGTITLTYNTLPNREWTDEEYEELDMLSDFLLILSSKARLTSKVIEMTSVINGFTRE